MKTGYILCLFCIVYPILDGLFNGYWLRYNTAKHWLNGSQAVLLGLLLGYLSFYNIPLVDPHDRLTEIIEICISMLGFRMIFFDPAFNIAAGRHLFSGGTTYFVDKYFHPILKFVWKWTLGFISVVLMAQWLWR